MDRLGQLIIYEKQASEFYNSGAQSVKDEGVNRIFSSMMKNSQLHLGLLEDLIKKGVAFEAEGEKYDTDIFKCLDDCGCAMIRAEELATYVAASDMERKILAAYASIKEKLTDEQVIEIVAYIQKKHKDALFILTEMIEMLNRSSDWVESAEFTIREPY